VGQQLRLDIRPSIPQECTHGRIPLNPETASRPQSAKSDFLSIFLSISIENAFKNLRRHIGRVCRWRKNSDQADLWVASGLLLAQKGFRKIKGRKDIEALVKALELYGKEEKAA
jgi:hypothetical protein